MGKPSTTKPLLAQLLAAAVLVIVTSTLLAGRAAAHGTRIDLDGYCKEINYRGGIKLPTDPKWFAR